MLETDVCLLYFECRTALKAFSHVLIRRHAPEPSPSQARCLQGFGQHIRTNQAGTPAFQKALMAVLTDPRYTQAAQAMSVKIRARKNTPVQEAAGAQVYPPRPTMYPLCLQTVHFALPRYKRLYMIQGDGCYVAPLCCAEDTTWCCLDRICCLPYM